MTRSASQFEELGRLTAVLCDGEISPGEALRLEQLASRSREARQYFLQYVQLHGELHWERAAGAGRVPLQELESLLDVGGAAAEPAPTVQPPAPAGKPPRALPHWAAMAATVAFFTVATVVGLSLARLWRGQPDQPSERLLAARLVGTFEARWADGLTRTDGTGFDAGQRLNLQEGLVEIRFDSGAGVILEGPATFDVATPARGFLHSGSLTANVPGQAAGFTIETPSAMVVDRGTEFGVRVEKGGPSEVHVLAGTVEVHLNAGPAGERVRQEVDAGQAVRVPGPAAGSEPRIQEIALDCDRFVRSMLVPGSVAALRAVVARHPNLIHHYTFEGATPQEKCYDKKGDLHLLEAVMVGGRGDDGDGGIDCSAPGLDDNTNAIQPYRPPRRGNEQGIGLQSKECFYPPQTLTIELLLNFRGLSGQAEGEISAAIATRESGSYCGFFIVAADEGRLVHLMDGDADWIEGDVEFIPGDWYYVAGTFRVDSGQTIINSYVANLSREDPTLRWVVRDRVAAGVPAASRLGIGKGFAENVANAYPWPGSLDEVAVYDAVLDRQTLERHLRVLTGDGEP